MAVLRGCPAGRDRWGLGRLIILRPRPLPAVDMCPSALEGSDEVVPVISLGCLVKPPHMVLDLVVPGRRHKMKRPRECARDQALVAPEPTEATLWPNSLKLPVLICSGEPWSTCIPYVGLCPTTRTHQGRWYSTYLTAASSSTDVMLRRWLNFLDLLVLNPGSLERGVDEEPAGRGSWGGAALSPGGSHVM